MPETHTIELSSMRVNITGLKLKPGNTNILSQERRVHIWHFLSPDLVLALLPTYHLPTQGPEDGLAGKSLFYIRMYFIFVAGVFMTHPLFYFF